ncbi:MAG: WD40 repeat domain-containing protein [Bacteroidales bacterium]|nr:WD40 repeat domain-containing protein [Bacteroidales bacterium]
MKNKNRNILLVIGFVMVCLMAGILACRNHKPAPAPEITEAPMEENEEPYEIMSPDSNYRIVLDTMAHVWNVRSSEKVCDFYIHYSAESLDMGIKQLEFHPKSPIFLVLDNMNILSAYDYISGSCIEYNDEYYEQRNHISFSEDGKYLLMVDYAESAVEMLQWPGLKYIATGYLGRYRNNFDWKEKNGLITFYYDEGDGQCKIEFPHRTKSGEIGFSEEEVVEKAK